VGVETDHIPIELDERRFAGLVRQEAFPGQGLPDLIAHRPEPWRFLRLARIVGAAKAIADLSLGQGKGDALIKAMISIEDYKGDFAVNWRASIYEKQYEAIVEGALASQGEDEIVHVIDSAL
jgi:hypothetical protein